ncbi:hypothetical protein [Sulfurimonas sp.]|nr:hypothetical protein [Sulfurimonas sp.]
MRKVILIILVLTIVIFSGCASKAIQLEESPCAINNVTYLIRV